MTCHRFSSGRLVAKFLSDTGQPLGHRPPTSRRREQSGDKSPHSKAVAGWKDFAYMQKDPDLTPLRDFPEFKALLKP